MQLQDAQYPNIFAMGDIADTGGQKSVFAALGQVTAVSNNVQSLIQGEEPAATFAPIHPGIHITIGRELSVTFHSPHPERRGTEVEPEVTYYHKYVIAFYPLLFPFLTSQCESFVANEFNSVSPDLKVGYMWENLGFTAQDAENA